MTENFRHKLRQLNVVISPLTESLLYNTRENRNFSTLIELFIQRSSELETSFNCQKYVFFSSIYCAIVNIKPTYL